MVQPVVPLAVPIATTTYVGGGPYYAGVGGVRPAVGAVGAVGAPARTLVRTVRRERVPQNPRRNACIGIIICVVSTLLIFFIVRWAWNRAANVPLVRVVPVAPVVTTRRIIHIREHNHLEPGRWGMLGHQS